MKKLIQGLLLGLTAFVLLVGIVSAAADTPFLTYVYSQSMEPVLHVNDAFFVWPSKSYAVGDVVVYRPAVLDAERITHRIVAVGATGFTTQGDNNFSTDQASGEPQVTNDRIEGRVVTWNGRLLVLQGLGGLAGGVSTGFAPVLRLVSGILIAFGVLSLVWGLLFPKRRRKTRTRLRLHHVYRVATFIGLGVLFVAILSGSRTTQIRYLVSQNPGGTGNQVAVGSPGTLLLAIHNPGLLPTWHFTQGLGGLLVVEEPVIVLPLTDSTMTVSTPASAQTGWKQGYLLSYHYPVVLPRFVMEALYPLGHWPTLAVTSLVLYLYLFLLSKGIGRIPGLEGWIPLKAIKDKVLARHWLRIRGRFLPRKRVGS